MKYIKTERLGIVIFEDWITHSAMVSKLNILPEEIQSAGEVAIDGTAYCTGESISLGVRSQSTGSFYLQHRIGREF